MNRVLIYSFFLIQYWTPSVQADRDYAIILDDIVKRPVPQYVSIGELRFPLFWFDPLDKVKDIAEVPLEILFVNAFLFLSGWQEQVVKKRDVFGRFPFSESLQSKYSFQFVPVVNLIFTEICRRINSSGNHCKSRKFGSKGSNIVFSHDIDKLYSGWYESTGHLIRHPGFSTLRKWVSVSHAKFFNKQDDYQTGFYRLLGLLEKWDIKSLFFFLANQSKDDADYDLTDPLIWKILQNLMSLRFSKFI